MLPTAWILMLDDMTMFMYSVLLRMWKEAVVWSV